MDDMPTPQELAEARANAQAIADAAGVPLADVTEMLDAADSIVKQESQIIPSDQSPTKGYTIGPAREGKLAKVDKFLHATERQFLDAFLLGHYPQLMASLKRVASPLTGEDRPYTEIRDDLRKQTDADPGAAKVLGKVPGYLTQAAALPLRSLPAAMLSSPWRRLGTGGLVGGAQAFATNPGDKPGEVDMLQLGERASNVPAGVATGVAAAGLGEGFLAMDRQYVVPVRKVMELRENPREYNAAMQRMLLEQAEALERMRSQKFDELRAAYQGKAVRMSPEELAGQSPEARAALLEQLGLVDDTARFEQQMAEMAGKGRQPAPMTRNRSRDLVASGMEEQKPILPLTYEEQIQILASRENPSSPASHYSVDPVTATVAAQTSAVPVRPGRFPPNANTMPAPMTGVRGQPVVPKKVILPAEADIPLEAIHDLKIAEDALAKRPAGTVFSEGEAAKVKIHGDTSNRARAILEREEARSAPMNADMQRLIRLRNFMRKQAKSANPGLLAESNLASRQGILQEAAERGGNSQLLDMAKNVRIAKQLEWPTMLRDVLRHPIESTVASPLRLSAWGALKASRAAAPIQASPVLSAELSRLIAAGLIDAEDLEKLKKDVGAK